MYEDNPNRPRTQGADSPDRAEESRRKAAQRRRVNRQTMIEPEPDTQLSLFYMPPPSDTRREH